MSPTPDDKLGRAANPDIIGFFDPATCSVSYLVVDPATRAAGVIDPVLDFDAKAGRISTTSADRVIAAAAGMKVEWVLETHTHADHLSAADHIKARTGARTGTGAHIGEVQKTWAEIYNLEPGFRTDGSQFDRLFDDGERFKLGTLDVTVWHTPGHTPACSSFIVEGADCLKHVFVGDTLFMPDYGTARADFPGGCARTLYRSIRRVLCLPPETRLYICHDYQPNGRAVAWQTTVAEQRAGNLHIKDGVSEDDFVKFRQERDKTLATPALILPAIQVNIRGGRLPPPDPNGTVYLRLPVNRL
ncbi:MAG TPA: MBL fold metallo-hydrolase [Alphaproteobacteria bacterium]|nr:MBL fold metallo-hydrolase [Alphaproteobacteria bacterium]